MKYLENSDQSADSALAADASGLLCAGSESRWTPYVEHAAQEGGRVVLEKLMAGDWGTPNGSDPDLMLEIVGRIFKNAQRNGLEIFDPSSL